MSVYDRITLVHQRILLFSEPSAIGRNKPSKHGVHKFRAVWLEVVDVKAQTENCVCRMLWATLRMSPLREWPACEDGVNREYSNMSINTRRFDEETGKIQGKHGRTARVEGRESEWSPGYATRQPIIQAAGFPAQDVLESF